MRSLRVALTMLIGLGLVTGLLYPLLVTAIAHVQFPARSSGSLLRLDGRIVGSALVAQPFADPRYFWPRPSATPRRPYDASLSGGSNLGPTNEALAAAVRRRTAALRAADPTQNAPIPIDLVTASASGLDPHISPAAALWQVPRVARARGLPVSVVRDLVLSHVEGRTLGFLGEPRVNVLQLDVALDALP
jgi:potassium-transporting ATPase KdpC subunit